MIIAATTQNWDIVSIPMLRDDRKSTAGPAKRMVMVGIEDVPQLMTPRLTEIAPP